MPAVGFSGSEYYIEEGFVVKLDTEKVVRTLICESTHLHHDSRGVKL